MGGPAQPMPQDMMPPPPAPAMMPPQGVEQQIVDAEMQGQQAGMQMADNMMAQLDGAEDYQSMIDGIRGNSMPLEARYQELASLVGEQDAMATPESVLALTQPTIMMTEQGAMDSGIGELMQGIAGSVDMEGPMDEGVGSLMAAGAGNTPPVNFRNGGPVEVRGYQDGTEVRPGGGSRILTQAEKNVADYEKYFAGGFDQEARAAALEEQNKMSRAQMLFDVAGTALNFAGQTQGGSLAERLANSVTQSQLTDKIGQRAAGMLTAKQAQAAEDRQMRMSARHASLGQAQTDEKARQDLAIARARKKNGEAKYQRLVGPDGKPLGTFNIGTAEGVTNLDAAIAANPNANLYNLGTEPSDSGKADLKIVVSKDGTEQTFDLNTEDGQSGFKAASGQDGAKVYNVSSAPSDAGYKTITLYDPENPTVPVTRPVNTAEERRKVSALLASGYTSDDKKSAGAISEEFTINKEDRAVTAAIAEENRNLKTTLAAEARLLDTTIGSEKRAVLTLIAKEGRAKTQVIEAETRLQKTTLGSEARSLATKKLQEKRNELAAIRKEGRDVKTQIEREKRDLATTIAAEGRGVVIKTDAETRAEGFRVSAEARLLDTTINSETRNVLTLIARESRAEETAIRQEIRANDTTLSAEDRAEARLLAKEARGELTTIRAEGRSLKTKIAAEKRNLETTIASENRATARETVVYGRDRTDELADIDATVVRKIAEEERALGRTLKAEERAQVTWEARNTITTKNDLDRLAIAQGISDTSQIAAEDRRAIVDQNKFDQNQAAKIAEEIRAVANRDTIKLRLVGTELLRVDTLTGDTKVLFGEPKIPDPSMAQVTLRNAEGVPVTAVIDINSPQGKAVLDQVNAANAAAPGSASYQKVPTASTTVQGFLIYNEDKTVKGVYTSYDGKTYIDDDGNAQIITGGSHPVNDTIAYDVAKNEKLVSGARAQLQALDSEIISQMTTFDKDGNPIALNKKQQAEVRDAFAAARKGTGFWSKIYAGIDAVAGGIAPGLFSDLFKDTTDARQFVKMVRVLGRSALASSPRFAMGDLNAVQGLFPDEQALLRSPSTEAAKLNDIVFYLDEEKRRLLGKIASGDPMDSTMKSQVNQKLFEINRLETILGPVAMLGQASENAADFDSALSTITRARQRAKDAKD